MVSKSANSRECNLGTEKWGFSSIPEASTIVFRGSMVVAVHGTWKGVMCAH